MDRNNDRGLLCARCIVCRGDIHEHDTFEKWKDGFYCARHSLPLLRERARLYAQLVAREAASLRG